MTDLQGFDSIQRIVIFGFITVVIGIVWTLSFQAAWASRSGILSR